MGIDRRRRFLRVLPHVRGPRLHYLHKSIPPPGEYRPRRLLVPRFVARHRRQAVAGTRLCEPYIPEAANEEEGTCPSAQTVRGNSLPLPVPAARRLSLNGRAFSC
jgi:hypothetical protein